MNKRSGINIINNSVLPVRSTTNILEVENHDRQLLSVRFLRVPFVSSNKKIVNYKQRALSSINIPVSLAR